MMDPIARAFYEFRFEREFSSRKADEFQALFSSIMEKRYPSDFVRVRPWGKDGDQKCDGYLRSKRMLFQCYAPIKPRAAVCVAKIDEDFAGALMHWREHLDAWVFVHNACDGLSPQVIAKLLNLAKSHASIVVAHWGFEELRQEAMALSELHLASLLGPAPTRGGMTALALNDLVPVLDHIGRLAPSKEPDLRPVPGDKLQRNLLSDAAGHLLLAGMGRADLVGKYFKLQPTLQDQVAEAFRRKYRELRDTGVHPDEIFAELQRFAGGAFISSPSQQCGVLACLAFFFEKCDIFERPESAGELSS